MSANEACQERIIPTAQELTVALQLLANTIKRHTELRDQVIHHLSTDHRLSLRQIGFHADLTYSTVKNIRDRISSTEPWELGELMNRLAPKGREP